VKGFGDHEAFASQRWTHSRGLDLGCLRVVVEQNHFYPALVDSDEAIADAIRRCFARRADGLFHVPGFPLDAKTKFRTWMMDYMRDPYFGWVQGAPMFYTPDLRLQPGMPPQTTANHPRFNFYIWPATLPRFFWDNLQRYLAGRFAAIGVRPPEGYLRPWSTPRFNPVSPGTPAMERPVIYDSDSD
jgi:hypothetical protein